MLNFVGLGSGWCDGIQGPVFRNAVTRFQKIIGVRPEGFLTHAEFWQLLAGGSVPPCACHAGEYCGADGGVDAH